MIKSKEEIVMKEKTETNKTSGKVMSDKQWHDEYFKKMLVKEGSTSVKGSVSLRTLTKDQKEILKGFIRYPKTTGLNAWTANEAKIVRQLSIKGFLYITEKTDDNYEYTAMRYILTSKGEEIVKRLKEMV